jgi:hypothetical protein
MRRTRGDIARRRRLAAADRLWLLLVERFVDRVADDFADDEELDLFCVSEGFTGCFPSALC